MDVGDTSIFRAINTRGESVIQIYIAIKVTSLVLSSRGIYTIIEKTHRKVCFHEQKQYFQRWNSLFWKLILQKMMKPDDIQLKK